MPSDVCTISIPLWPISISLPCEPLGSLKSTSSVTTGCTWEINAQKGVCGPREVQMPHCILLRQGLTVTTIVISTLVIVSC